MSIKILLKKITKNNKWLIIGIELCLLLSFICFLYGYNFLIKITILDCDNNYTINTNNKLYTEIHNDLKKLNFENYSNINLTLDNNIKVLVHGDFPFLINGRKILNQNEIISGKIEDRVKIGSTISVLDKDYILVGVSTFINSDYLLLVDSISKDTKINSIEIQSNLNVSPYDIKNEIKRSFKGNSITFPDDIKIGNIMENYNMSIPFAIILALTIFSLAICFKFLIDEIEKPLQLYKYSGFSYNKIIITLCLYQLAFLVIPILLGSLLYLTLEIYCFNTTTIFLPVKYNLQFKNYMQITFIIILLQLLFILPFMRKIAKKNIEVRNYED